MSNEVQDEGENAPDTPQDTTSTQKHNPKAYWNSSLKIVAIILVIWAFVSLGCSILFKEQLDSMASVGSAPLGFWMAQQGSIIVFVLLLVLYAFLMNRLDKKHGYDEEDE